MAGPQGEWTLAPWELSEVGQLGLTRDELFALAGLRDDEDDTIHRLLGHPEPIQGDMQSSANWRATVCTAVTPPALA